MVYFSSDFHLGHNSILKYRTKFSSIEEHDEAIFKEMDKLKKRDILYIIGDFLFDCDNFENYLLRISKYPFRIKLVMGNHDSLKLYSQTIAKNIEIQLPLFSYKNNWITHCPIHPKEIRGRGKIIHGHLHGDIIDDPRYFNVNLDNNGFKFVDFDYIKSL